MIIQNALITPDGYILNSTHTHAFVEKDGYAVDGGLQYIKRSFKTQDYTDINLTIKDSLEKICHDLICERQNNFWRRMTIEEIKKERKKIFNAYKTNKWLEYNSFTRAHAILHIYVSGYWLVKKQLEN